MNIVLVCPSGAISSVLDRIRATGGESADEVTVVSWRRRDVDATDTQSIIVGHPLGSFSRAMNDALRGSVVGRNVLRLSPIDGGRRMWRATRREPRFRAAVTRADLIVAVERDGILTAWMAARTLAPSTARAVYGAAPAEALLRIARQDG